MKNISINLVKQNRKQHTQEIVRFLQNHFQHNHWQLTLPQWGKGHETYIAHRDTQTYFIKLNVHIAHYQAMAALDLTPGIITSGKLENGTTILVQTYVTGRKPSWQDFQDYLQKIATVISLTHHNTAVKQVLPTVSSELYSIAGINAMSQLQQKWQPYKPLVPGLAEEIDNDLANLRQEIQTIPGGGLVASHNDVCNANWLITPDERVYLIDLDAMTQDDPAHDIGALLWWYYPPELRARFMKVVGYTYDSAFKQRMRVRMAMHCLDILLPRQQSFDAFDPNTFAEQLADFKAVLTGKENPRGYEDM